jgi:hypothetical protein
LVMFISTTNPRRASWIVMIAQGFIAMCCFQSVG